MVSWCSNFIILWLLWEFKVVVGLLVIIILGFLDRVWVIVIFCFWLLDKFCGCSWVWGVKFICFKSIWVLCFVVLFLIFFIFRVIFIFFVVVNVGNKLNFWKIKLMFWSLNLVNWCLDILVIFCFKRYILLDVGVNNFVKIDSKVVLLELDGFINNCILFFCIVKLIFLSIW